LSFVATLVFAGPRALAVTRSRVAALRGDSSPRGVQIDLDRVGVLHAPTWLRSDLLTQVALDLAPVLGGGIGMADQAAAAAVVANLRAVPWVREASLQRVYPDRMRACLTLRRPVARLSVAKPAGTEMQALDGEGVCLPCPPTCDLPAIVAARPQLSALGQAHADPAVLAAAAVAEEWRVAIAPRLAQPLRLARVDVTNFGYQADAARWCEISVAVARADGGLVWLDYDHPPGSDAPRVPAAAKVEVLQKLLAAHPGLAGVARADLRFQKRWQAWVEMQSPP
jgi:hypothetical protein